MPTVPPVGAYTSERSSSHQLRVSGCQTCWSFDLHTGPGSGPSGEPSSWAGDEYDIDPKTRARVTEISPATLVVKSADEGCFYCKLIRAALAELVPAWETASRHLLVHVAAGLPVVVELVYGTRIASTTMGSPAARGLGVAVAENQSMQLTATLYEDKPPTAIEIYRPSIASGPAPSYDPSMAQYVDRIGRAEDRCEHSSESYCFQFIVKHVNRCFSQHKCGSSSNGKAPILPDRVIWLKAPNDSGLKLLETKGIRARYITLSYCWGPVKPDIYLTDAKTLESRKAEIKFADLPPLFQDVVMISRRLGIEYLWIDRLCIIQGDAEDFKCQAPKMGEIYGDSFLTIAAASAVSEDDHILTQRGSDWHSYAMDFKLSSLGSVSIHYRRRSHLLGTENQGGRYGKVSTRAWIWQERLLATRTIFYTGSELKFECHSTAAWEGFDDAHSGHSWSAQLENKPHLSWSQLLAEYTRRDITRQSDRLPALEAVMKRIAKTTGWKPIHGLWKETLIQTLGWKCNGIGRMNPDRYAPSWSWASVNGPISYILTTGAGPGENDPLTYSLKLSSVDATSGSLVVSGFVEHIKLCMPSLASTVRGERRYEIGVRGWRGIEADAHLEPFNGMVEGQSVSTTVRVPFGKELPLDGWISPCAVLLVGSRSLRCVALVLGQSPRVANAWERLGVVSGLESDIFRFPSKAKLTIV